jgi:hypothetical protein
MVDMTFGASYTAIVPESLQKTPNFWNASTRDRVLSTTKYEAMAVSTSWLSDVTS